MDLINKLVNYFWLLTVKGVNNSFFLPLGRRVIKFEFEDEDGGKYLFRLEGEITREKVLKLLDIYELMNLKTNKAEKSSIKEPNSLQDKILILIEKQLTFREFTSKELQELYEDEYNEPIKLSVVSTYLRRFTDNGILDRVKNGREWKYKLKVEATQFLRKHMR